MDNAALPRQLSPLSDPSKQIRLLLLRDGQDDEIISGDISHHPIDDAPSFRAISYTWGSPDMLGTVKINGHECTVRQNCAYALWQTRRRCPESYVWIDSICINQQDNDEKSAQVQMMGDVYANAIEVLACVGPADESSEYICQVLPDMDKHIQDFPDEWWDDPTLEERERLWRPPVLATKDGLLRLLEHWNKFSDRPYFSRVWIVQELFGGQDRSIILCGTTSMRWDGLLELQLRMIACFNQYTSPFSLGDSAPDCSEIIFHIFGRLIAHDADDFKFPSILDGPAACEDPRDRIYGILRLIDWKRFNVPCPVVDYNITLMQLALQTMERLTDTRIYGASLIAQALEIDMDDPSTHSLLHYDSGGFKRMWNSSVSGACRIYKNETGRLTVDLRKTEDLDGSTDVQVIAQQIEERTLENGLVPFGGDDTLAIYTEGIISILACRQTLPGDVLVPTSYAGVLVLRPTGNSGTYNMIGKAIIVNGHTVHHASDWACACWPKAEGDHKYTKKFITLEFELTDKEALFLAAARREDDPLKSLHHTCSNAPLVGTIVKDITSRNWASDEKIRHFHDDCLVHGKINERLHALGPLDISVQAQFGAYVQSYGG